MKKGKLVLVIIIFALVLAGLVLFARFCGSSAKERSLAAIETPSYVLDENGERETDPDSKKPYIVETNVAGNLQTTYHAGRDFGDLAESSKEDSPMNPGSEEDTIPALDINDTGSDETNFTNEPSSTAKPTEGDVIGGGSIKPY